LDDAIAEFREAIRLKKDYAKAHENFGYALMLKGRLDEAIAEYREVVRLKKDYPVAHYNLGNVLKEKGRLNEAIAEYQEAIRLKKALAEAHCNLGRAFLQQGRFADALAALKRGHELGSRRPGWPCPSAQWVREAERLVALEGKLPMFLKGEAKPADAGERIALAQMCQLHKGLYAAAARFYGEAFVSQPKLAENLGSAGGRYDAACAAALAGCGQGKDANQTDDIERARLRRQALAWLRADLTAWRRVMEQQPAKASPAVRQQMQHWLSDDDFAGVRGSDALAKLPEAERNEWRKLWQEVETLRRRAAA
jgi:tetratricopeptide (TPR) repeat protein